MFAVLFGEVLKYWIENLSIVWNGKDLKIESIPYYEKIQPKLGVSC